MWADRQLPQGEDVFLDHVGYFVADLDAAGAQLERLGFRVSQINVQTNADAKGLLKPSGTSNRLAKLKFGFLEILAATHDTPLADQFKQQIARYSGLHLIALSHDDLSATRARLVQAGFAMQDAVELRRRDRTLPGAPEVHFSVLRPQPGVMAEGRVQWVTPRTPDTVWRAETITTENGAEGLTDMLLGVDDPAAVAARYGRYVGRTPVGAWRGACRDAGSRRAGVRGRGASREDLAGLPSAIVAVHGRAGAVRRSVADSRDAYAQRDQAGVLLKRHDLPRACRCARRVHAVSCALCDRSVERASIVERGA